MQGWKGIRRNWVVYDLTADFRSKSSSAACSGDSGIREVRSFRAVMWSRGLFTDSTPNSVWSWKQKTENDPEDTDPV